MTVECTFIDICMWGKMYIQRFAQSIKTLFIVFFKPLFFKFIGKSCQGDLTDTSYSNEQLIVYIAYLAINVYVMKVFPNFGKKIYRIILYLARRVHLSSFITCSLIKLAYLPLYNSLVVAHTIQIIYRSDMTSLLCMLE